MEIQTLKYDFTVCKVADVTQIDFSREFVFVSKTDEELSLVCESDLVPPEPIAAEQGWKALKISGVLDFGMVGVIAKIANLLARAGISLFVVSTYNTDYVLVKAEKLTQTREILAQSGYVMG